MKFSEIVYLRTFYRCQGDKLYHYFFLAFVCIRLHPTCIRFASERQARHHGAPRCGVVFRYFRTVPDLSSGTVRCEAKYRTVARLGALSREEHKFRGGKYIMVALLQHRRELYATILIVDVLVFSVVDQAA